MPQPKAERIAELEQQLADRFDQFAHTIDLLSEYAALDREHRIPPNYYFTAPRVFPTNGVAIAMMKKRADGSDHVFLMRQPHDHPLWPGMWHIPGTTQRHGDTLNKMFRRIFNEIGHKSDFHATKPPRLMVEETSTLKINERGPGMHRVYLTWVPSGTEFPTGQFFPIREHPDGTIKFVRLLLARLYRALYPPKPARPKRRRARK